MPTSEEVLQVVKNADSPITAPEIADILDAKPAYVSNRLTHLYRDGKVDRVGRRLKPGPGTPFEYVIHGESGG